jgi:hypothetical protein
MAQTSGGTQKSLSTRRMAAGSAAARFLKIAVRVEHSVDDVRVKERCELM